LFTGSSIKDLSLLLELLLQQLYL